jgi:hypothetical protein
MLYNASAQQGEMLWLFNKLIEIICVGMWIALFLF